MERVNVRGGSIEIITGSMFSGKTEELIRRIKRAQIAKQNIQIFKPKIDQRYDSAGDIVSHNLNKIDAVSIEHVIEIFEVLKPTTQVIAIDEAQFFDNEIVQVCQTLADQGLRVIVAGLDTDYRSLPFGPMPSLFAIAEFVTKQHAICVKCGSIASRTQRTVTSSDDILVGASEAYEARCRICFEPPKSESTNKTLPDENFKDMETTWNI